MLNTLANEVGLMRFPPKIDYYDLVTQERPSINLSFCCTHHPTWDPLISAQAKQLIVHVY